MDGAELTVGDVGAGEIVGSCGSIAEDGSTDVDGAGLTVGALGACETVGSMGSGGSRAEDGIPLLDGEAELLLGL